MRNRYPGICCYCGKRVEANEGHFEHISKEEWYPGCAKWKLIHSECVYKRRFEKYGVYNKWEIGSARKKRE